MEVLNNADLEVADFQQDVIEKSFNKPVLVDFWAPWCGPCKMLSPLLEKAFQEFGGQFVLAKVNVDNNQDLAGQYSVRGIPACKLFKDGQIIDEFTGVIPKMALQEFLEKHLPNDRKLAIRDAGQMMAEGNTQAGIDQLEQLLEEQDDTAIRITLAQAYFQTAPHKARSLVTDIYEDDPRYQEAQGILVLATLLEAAQDPACLPDDTVKGQLVAAGEALAQQNYDTALEQLINSILQNKAYQEELARKACIAIFDLLGREHKITQKYRRRFDMSLY